MIDIIIIIFLLICCMVLVSLEIKRANRQHIIDITQLAKQMYPEIDNPIVALDNLYKHYYRATLAAIKSDDVVWEAYWKLCQAIRMERERQLQQSVSFETNCLNIMRPISR